MNAVRAMSCFFALIWTVYNLQAHTTAESNMVVRCALQCAAYGGSCRPHIDLPYDVNPPNTWQGFLGGDTNGWTLAEKKAAFDWYLVTLGTKDCRIGGIGERDEIDAAVSRCLVLNYTNAVPALKALALNPNGVVRDDAIKVVMKFSACGAQGVILRRRGWLQSDFIVALWNRCPQCYNAIMAHFHNLTITMSLAAIPGRTLTFLLHFSLLRYAKESAKLIAS